MDSGTDEEDNMLAAAAKRLYPSYMTQQQLSEIENRTENNQETSGRVNLIYQMDVIDSTKNSIIACWLTNNNTQDVKSITLSKSKMISVNNVLNDCGNWVLKASKNKKWLNKHKYKTQKMKEKLLNMQLLKNFDPSTI